MIPQRRVAPFETSVQQGRGAESFLRISQSGKVSSDLPDLFFRQRRIGHAPGVRNVTVGGQQKDA